MDLIPFLRTNFRFLGAGMVISFSSSYGQTFFVSLFAAQIMAAYELSHGQWGAVYTVATMASAIVMFWVGAVTDHFRVRLLAWAVMPGLMLTCLWMAVNTWLIGLVAIVFLLRFLGQGMMSQLAVTAMARWFVARRGLALSISAIGFAVGTAFFPVLFASLLERFEWRSLWILAGALVIITLPVVLWLLSAERTPQSHAEKSNAVGMDGRHWTRNEVIATPFFWLLMPMLLGPPAWGTALFFQQVHMAEVKGFSLVEYLALLPLLTIVSVTFMLISGQLIDRLGSARLIQVYLLPFALAFVVISLSDSLFGVAIGLMIFGIGTGVQATVPAAFWAEFFGTRHIGAIKAVSTSVMVFGSAIGPGISGMLIDLGYDYPSQMLAYAVYFVAASMLVWVAVEKARPRLTVSREIDVKGT